MLSDSPIPHQTNSRELWDAHRIACSQSISVAVGELGEIAEAYVLAIEVVASLASQATDRLGNSSPNAYKTEAILSGYIVGLTLVEHAILSGYSAQAAALVRQELEAMAALEEIAQEVRQEGKTPNIRHVPSVPGTVYGDLSKLAHFSDTSALREVAALKADLPLSLAHAEGWLLSPQHVPNTTKQLFALHTHLLLQFAARQSTHYCELHGIQQSEQQLDAVARAWAFLCAADVSEEAPIALTK